MRSIFSLKFHLVILLLLGSVSAWALQDGIVIVDRAVIYADRQMSSPLGFIRKGKKVRLGNIPRNKAQVYPIAISGKVGYIRIQDVSTEVHSLNDNYLAAERFTKNTKKNLETKYSVGYLTYNSQISLTDDNGGVDNSEPISWSGLTLKGEIELDSYWDLSIILNYLQAEKSPVKFRMVELGAGMGYKLYQSDRFIIRWDLQGLAVPFSSYAVASDFRVNGYGLTLGTGINGVWKVGENLGLEAFGGLHYTKLTGFEPPEPYKSISPSFMGSRLGLGLNYQY